MLPAENYISTFLTHARGKIPPLFARPNFFSFLRSIYVRADMISEALGIWQEDTCVETLSELYSSFSPLICVWRTFLRPTTENTPP